MKKPAWLNRTLLLGPYLTLCLTQQDLDKAVKHLDCKDPLTPFKWTAQGHGRVYALETDSGDPACLVCISGTAGLKGVEVAGLIVHEAVHVWQVFRDAIGEESPSAEFEAYSIQSIAQELMTEYTRRVHGPH